MNKNIWRLITIVSLLFVSNTFAAEKLKTEQANQQIADAMKAIALSVSSIASAASAAQAQMTSAASGVAQAAPLPNSDINKAAATTKDNNDWTGDHIQIFSNLEGLEKSQGNDGSKFTAPAYARFIVSEEKEGKVRVTPKDNIGESLGKNKRKMTPSKGHGIYGFFNLIQWGDVDINLPDQAQIVEPNVTYIVDKSEIEKLPYVKYGWTYGALLVPFKWHANYKALNFSNSAQMYLGYKRDSNGTAEGPFISAGLSTADIPTAAGQSNSKQGFSYGMGWLFEIKKSSGFQVMVMAGQDVFGASAGYPYEGDTWYSVSFGMSFEPQKTK